MLRDVFLHGALGRRFGRHWQLDIASPAEAVRALCALRPGLERELKASGFWRVVVGTPRVRNSIPIELLHMNAGSQAIHLVPATPPHGGDPLAAVGMIVIGVALVATAMFTAGATLAAAAAFIGTTEATLSTVVIGVGLSLTFGGVAALLSPRLQAQGTATDQARPEDRPSFLFTGTTNNTQQGGPVPIVLGTHLVGSVLVAGSLNAQDIA